MSGLPCTTIRDAILSDGWMSKERRFKPWGPMDGHAAFVGDSEAPSLVPLRLVGSHS